MASHQRARICAAMIDLVAERGYRAVTVRELTRVAGVSTRTFYAHFAGKEECFLATFDLVVARAIRRIAAAQRGCRDWRELWRRALAAFVREPNAARLAFVEAFAAGDPALARMRHARTAFEAMIADGFQHAPDGTVASPDPLLVKGIAAGVERVARVRVLDGREQELPDLADEILRWALCYRHPAAAALTEQSGCASRGSAGVRLRILGAKDKNSEGPGWADDRTRILAATARLAASQGYTSLTVPRVRSAAGVSRRCFDAHFADVPACFVATLEHFASRALERAASAGTAAGDDWPLAVHRALGALLECLAHDPVLARIAFAEVSAAGLPGLRCRARILGEIARRLRQGAPARLRPSELAAEASVGAVWWILHEHIAAGRSCALPSLTGPLSFLLLAPALGAQQALAIIDAEQRGYSWQRSDCCARATAAC